MDTDKNSDFMETPGSPYRITFLRVFLSLIFVAAFPAASLADVSAAQESVDTVYLLLHGLNSDETTWNAVVRNLFGNHCPALREETDPSSLGNNRCYRFHFSDTTWPHGDGLTLGQLGDEVDHAVRKIRDQLHPTAIALIGHSRGGLAARAYLQQPGTVPSFHVALMTIGTPHQGSPFGRIKPFMDQNAVDIQDVPKSVRLKYRGVPLPIKVDARDRLEFMFSPSMGILVTETATYKGQVPCEQWKNRNLCRFNENVEQLRTYVGVFGQMISRGLVLGEKTPLKEGVDLDLLGNLSLKQLMPQLIPKLSSGDFVRMRAFVLSDITGNIPRSGNFCSNTVNPQQASWQWSKRNEDSWACNGDGIVPYISQRLGKLLPQASIASIRLSGVYHTQETGQTRNIKKLLSAMFQNHGEFQLP